MHHCNSFAWFESEKNRILVTHFSQGILCLDKPCYNLYKVCILFLYVSSEFRVLSSVLCSDTISTDGHDSICQKGFDYNKGYLFAFTFKRFLKFLSGIWDQRYIRKRRHNSITCRLGSVWGRRARKLLQNISMTTNDLWVTWGKHFLELPDKTERSKTIKL